MGLVDGYALLMPEGHDDEQGISHFYESVEGIAHIEACYREYFQLGVYAWSIPLNYVDALDSAHHHECAWGIDRIVPVERHCYGYARLRLACHVDV
ncbi:MAG: hypothetical protein ACQ9MH_04765 [Nitrospinales bacterium]